MSVHWIIAIALTPVTVVLAQSDLNAPSPSVQTTPVLSTQGRFRWVVLATLGPKSLGADLFIAGIQTWRNHPESYDAHWDGFARRYGARLAAEGTSNIMEAGIGGIWGEDPRYFRAAGQPMKRRIGHVVKMAFITHDRAGDPQLAYARFIAVPGSALISNTWRTDSPSTLSHVSLQVGLGFLGRIASNAFDEFAPDIREHRKRDSNSLLRETR